MRSSTSKGLRPAVFKFLLSFRFSLLPSAKTFPAVGGAVGSQENLIDALSPGSDASMP